MLSTRDPSQNKGHKQNESEGLEKIFHKNGDEKKAGIAILISHKKRQRRTLHNDQRSIQEEDIIIINIYAPNIGAPQYVRQMLLLLLLLLSRFSRVRLCATP